MTGVISFLAACPACQQPVRWTHTYPNALRITCDCKEPPK